MINLIKEELKSILEDLEKVKETSNVDHLIFKFHKAYKRLIIFQYKMENKNNTVESKQKEVSTVMETINEIVTEIPDETNNEIVEDLFSAVASPEFVMKDENANEISYESKKLNESLIKGVNIGLNDKIAFTKSLFDGNKFL